MEIFKTRLYKDNQEDLYDQNNQRFILTYLQTDSYLELFITGCLFEYIEKPYLRKSFQIFYSV